MKQRFILLLTGLLCSIFFASAQTTVSGTVVDASGEPVGRISDVIQNTAQDIYAITLDGSDLKTPVLVPAVAEFIRAVDVPGGTIRIHFIPGMISEPIRA